MDYGISKEDFSNKFEEPFLRGYQVIHRESITEDQLTPNGRTVYISPEEDENNPNDPFFWDWMKKLHCEWLIFERDNNAYNPNHAKRFSLLYLCADGAADYQAIYLSNQNRPKIIAIIQPGHAFGGNWTNFKDRKKIFAQSVFYSDDLLPDYIINGGWGSRDFYDYPIWPEYEKK